MSGKVSNNRAWSRDFWRWLVSRLNEGGNEITAAERSDTPGFFARALPIEEDQGIPDGGDNQSPKGKTARMFTTSKKGSKN